MHRHRNLSAAHVLIISSSPASCSSFLILDSEAETFQFNCLVRRRAKVKERFEVDDLGPQSESSMRLTRGLSSRLHFDCSAFVSRSHHPNTYPYMSTSSVPCLLPHQSQCALLQRPVAPHFTVSATVQTSPRPASSFPLAVFCALT